MYIFEAHYINIDDNKEIVRKIEFDGQFFENERECYLYAIEKAYNMKEKYEEIFVKLEFIAC